ncbi:MAG: M15 family metallopeptidase [Bdellovibrionia bacterium]
MIQMLFPLLLATLAHAAPCTYSSWTWDTKSKTSVNHQKVVTKTESLTKEERGTVAGCTVCEEDQIEVRLTGLPAFKVCRGFEKKFARAVERAAKDGFPFETIVAYRPGKSKGPVDSKGLRTEFSNHSFGTAIDINSEKNGLYDDCVKFSPRCRLIRGGKYDPSVKGTVTRESGIYKAMLSEGLKWGGEIEAKQKDFMHFSIDGM